MRFRSAGPLALALFALASPALASFHLMRIVQVYGGDASHPEGQFVVLKGCADFQNLFSGHPVVFFDDQGAEVGRATFAANLPDTATNQKSVLIATAAAQTAFGVVADLTMPPDLLVAGGKVCFDTVDCFAWGSYSVTDPSVGNPWEPSNGLPPAVSANRDLTAGGGATTLECSAPPTGDDSNDSAADFDSGTPAPTNYAGDVGALDPNLVFVYGFESGSTLGWSAVVP